MRDKNNVLKKFILPVSILATALLSILIFSGCLASEIPEITFSGNGELKSLQNTISVNGTGTIKLLPDEAFISIAAIAEKPTTQEAVNENSKISQDIIDEVNKINAENLDIQTTAYELTPLYDYSKENTPPKIYAYRAASTIRVKTTDLEKIGEIIAAATEAGASSISSIGFDLTDSTKRTAKNDALSAATTDASDKAIAIANAMGLKIDSVLYVSESGTVFPAPFMAIPEGLGELKAEAVAAPAIFPQEIEVVATINVVYVFTR